jgi:hypothetical protein
MELNTSAIISAQLYDDSGKMVDTKIFNIVGDVYNKWGGDDGYIINYIAEQLGSSYVSK